MKNKRMNSVCVALFGFMAVSAQIPSANDGIAVVSSKATAVPFSVSSEGEQFPVIWGLDTAWPDEWNMRRGTAFIGAENLGVIRVSFQPSDLIVNGELSSSQKSALENRLRLMRMSGVTHIALNCDHEVLMTPENATEAQKNQYAQHRTNYVGKPEEWVKLFEATAKYCQNKGFTVVSVSPFNEPDYGWNQGTRTDFYNIVKLMKENPFFDNIRICGGNTLNCDQALPWYNALKAYLDEGNTHQLAGEFNTYASFFETVRNDGKHATADELHNVMEAMVGVEYGMQTGIWWGFDGVARGEFCRASNNGDRLAYAENRSAWSSASVYRNNKEGKVQAFLGTSERQASTSTYQFVSTDRPVYFDGYGPVRAFTVEMPGGTGYQKGQTNAERVVNIAWGEDVPPYVNGEYVIQNKQTGNIMCMPQATASAGTNVIQKKHVTTAVYQRWNVQPVDSRIGGDFSYYSIIPSANTAFSLDVLNSSLENNASIIVYNDNKGAQQQWYLQYAGDGYFYIRSRQSSLCLQTSGGVNTQIKQGTFTGGDNQKWRFVKGNQKSDSAAPVAPSGLSASSLLAAIKLEWNENTEIDLAGYHILRAEVPAMGEDTLYNTIARSIDTCAFFDNSVVCGKTYLYKVRAEDKTGNVSASSSELKVGTAEGNGLIAKWQFDGDLNDETPHMLHATMGTISPSFMTIMKSGEKSLGLNGTSQFLQLSHDIASMEQMTICTWVFMRSNTAWQRIFDFGNGTGQYMFLTPTNGSQMRFVMKNGGDEEILSADALKSNTWNHVAVTIADDAVVLYLNGTEVARSTSMSIRPSDIRPALNYIGKSQFSADPLLKAYVDDFRIYNYALSPEEILSVTEDLATGIEDVVSDEESSIVSVEYYTLGGVRLSAPVKGQLCMVKYIYADGSVEVEKRWCK